MKFSKIAGQPKMTGEMFSGGDAPGGSKHPNRFKGDSHSSFDMSRKQGAAERHNAGGEHMSGKMANRKSHACGE
jgi:hypothetical protein